MTAPAAGGVEIVVEDDGPGIPEDRYEEAFKPFSRLDESRNQNRKGVGLGLATWRFVKLAALEEIGRRNSLRGDGHTLRS